MTEHKVTKCIFLWPNSDFDFLLSIKFFIIFIGEIKLTSMVDIIWFSESSSKGKLLATPALFIIISISSGFTSFSFKNSMIFFIFEILQGILIIFSLYSDLSDSNSDSLISKLIILQLNKVIKRWINSRPIPSEPPVIKIFVLLLVLLLNKEQIIS